MTLKHSIYSSIFTLLFGVSLTVQSAEPIPVVATFSIIGNMVERIGGKYVTVKTLVGADGDTHVFTPSPADARAVSEAKILITNGLGFEGWLDRLIDASDFEGTQLVATKGIEPIGFGEGDGHHDDHDEHGDEEKHHDDHGEDEGHHGHDHGAFDPHAWQSLKNAIAYVDNITTTLAQADPGNATTFFQNRASYVAEIKALNTEITSMLSVLPEGRRIVVTSHDAFQYFGRDYGLTFLAPQGFSTDSEASAKDVSILIKQMREKGISAVFVENISDDRLLSQIARETGAKIGGTLYPGALSGPNGPAPTYLKMMRHNAKMISQALAP